MTHLDYFYQLQLKKTFFWRNPNRIVFFSLFWLFYDLVIVYSQQQGQSQADAARDAPTASLRAQRRRQGALSP